MIAPPAPLPKLSSPTSWLLPDDSGAIDVHRRVRELGAKFNGCFRSQLTVMAQQGGLGAREEGVFPKGLLGGSEFMGATARDASRCGEIPNRLRDLVRVPNMLRRQRKCRSADRALAILAGEAGPLRSHGPPPRRS